MSFGWTVLFTSNTSASHICLFHLPSAFIFQAFFRLFFSRTSNKTEQSVSQNTLNSELKIKKLEKCFFLIIPLPLLIFLSENICAAKEPQGSEK